MSTLEEVQRQLREFQEQSKRQNDQLRREKEAAEARAENERREKEAAEARAENERCEKEAAEARAENERREKEAAEERANTLERHQAQTSFPDYVRNVEKHLFATNDQLRREKEAAEARAENERREKEAAEARAENERREKEAAEERANTLERHQAQTSFPDYVRNVEKHLFATLSIEPDKEIRSGQTTTSVEEKFYPQHFQPWADFAAIHAATFNNFTTTFAGNTYFPALAHVESLGEDLSPRVADELGIKPFIRASVEKPSSIVVSKYLQITGHEKFKEIKFKNNSYGIALGEIYERSTVAEDSLGPVRRQSPVRTIGVPDRWLVGCNSDGSAKLEPLLVGDIKPAHVFHGEKLNRVLSAPRDDFFVRAARQAEASASDSVPGEVYVAKAISQVFHYMITSGLEFGYLATGDGLVFLRVLEEDPNTLYYFGSVFPVDENAGVAATREPHETAMAHLATLCVLSLGSTRRSGGWITDRNRDLKKWPKAKKSVPSLAEMPLPILSFDKGGGAGGGAGGPGSAGGSGGASDGSPSKRKRPKGSQSSGTTGGKTGSHGTQKSSSMGPYVVEPPTLPYCTQACLLGLCRGATLDRNCPNASLHAAGARSKNGHALTADEIRRRVVAQLATNVDKDCQSFFDEGGYGRHGVLFKLAVTGFGYTFAAKAVLAQDRHILQHEVGIYTALGDFQGRLIPVCLGLIDLDCPVPLRNCQYVSHMLLMSYTGPDMADRKAVEHVDLDVEYRKTSRELFAAGLRNDDEHKANRAWCDEVHRVMIFDFDNAYMQALVAAEPPLQRSPLQAKRNLNADNMSPKQGEDGWMKKRARSMSVSSGPTSTH